jgi:hypothetical protein
MARAVVDDKDDEDDGGDFGPALARSVSVLRTATRCPECGRPTRVYALGCDAYKDAEDREFLDQFHFLHHVKSLPAEFLLSLRTICPGYRLDTGARSETYLMNHCGCGAKLSDDYLHGDAGAAFNPGTPDGFAYVKIIRRFDAQDIPIEASWTIDGGEFLAEER